MMIACTALNARVVDFGVTGGMNITKAEADNEYSAYGWTPDAKNGWYAGLQLKFTLPIVGFGLDVSAIYSENEATLRLATKDQLGSISTEDIDQKIGFITVPLHLRWDFNLPAVEYAVAPYIFTGPQASYSVKKFEDGLDNKYKDIKFKSEDLLWKWDLGMGVILLKRFQFSYAYEFPLSNGSSFKDMSVDNFEEDYKQGTHRIGLTYFF